MLRLHQETTLEIGEGTDEKDEATFDQSVNEAHEQTDMAASADPLTFLEHDSPIVTEERILQAIAAASENRSPRSISTVDTASTCQHSAADTDITIPDESVDRDTSASNHGHVRERPAPHRNRQPLHRQLDSEAQDRYGTPEMSRGPAKLPHISPSELQPRVFAPGQGHPKYLPRAEKLPMTGYEFLAAELSQTAGPAVKPIYRKFEALNHRLLLHLQDELSELEEQLHRLDTTDTQTRRLQDGILPASRRAESMAGGELQWRKTDILGKIGFKLGQYSKHTRCITDGAKN